MTTTTTMPAARKSLLAAFNRCIEAATDAEKGYATAAGDVRDPQLKVALQERSDERAEYVIALQRAVVELGGWPESQGSLEGHLHRAWIETRLAIEGRNDMTVLVECQRGERTCVEAYNTLLWRIGADATLPYTLRSMVARQHAAVTAAVVDLARRITGVA